MNAEQLNEIAWANFMSWAIHEPTIVAKFNRETGRRYRAPGPPPSDAELTADTEAFIRWATVEIWGADCAPAKLRATL